MDAIKRLWTDDNGQLYGPFSSQKDGFPNAGEVLQHYRERKNMSRAQLAKTLKVTPRRIEQMEHENTVPGSINRRRALATMLGVPAFLLGLASTNAIRPFEESKLAAPGVQRAFSVDRETINQYDLLRSAYWNTHYTGSGASVLPDAELTIQKLQTILPYAGDMRHEVINQLTGYYELASRISSDQNSPISQSFLNMALDLVNPSDTESYGRLLYKKGLALYEASDFVQAKIALEEAYTLIPKLSTALAGSILLQLALIQSYSSETAERSSALKLFSRAGSLVRSSSLTEVEGVRLDEGRYLTAFAEGLINLGKLSDAEDILDLAREKTNPILTKRLLFVDVQGIRLYAKQKEFAMVSDAAQEALVKAKHVKSVVAEQKIRTILQAIPKKTR